MNPFQVVDDFETNLCRYTGAPFAVAVASCTDAIGICFEYLKQTYGIKLICLPKHTYVGVAMQAKREKLKIKFENVEWAGEYRIPLYSSYKDRQVAIALYDSARRFHKNMYRDVDPLLNIQCVSFHGSKILGYSHGGAILHNNPVFNEWARQARFDGRPWKGDQPTVLGRHANMTPDVAAALNYKLYHLPDNNPDLPNSDYPDLSKMDIFK